MTEASAPPRFPAVRGIAESGEVVEIKPPETAQEAVDSRARARMIGKALLDWAGWLDGEAVTLMEREGAQAVIDADGRMWRLGTQNAYGLMVDAAACRDELLLAANDPEYAGSATAIALIERAFTYIDPPKPAAFWKHDNVALNVIEALGGKFAAIVERHRGKTTPGAVLREKK